MPRYTKAATAARDTYVELVNQIRAFRPADIRSFRRALLDIGQATMHDEGPLVDDLGCGRHDLHLDHYDALDSIYQVTNLQVDDDAPGFDTALKDRTR